MNVPSPLIPHASRRLLRRVSGSTRYGQAGVGLIEVLVAVLVLSIAFLGIAALQARSLSTNNSAMARSMATISSYSILDAMRADSASAQNGAYNQTVTANACHADEATLVGLQLNAWCAQLGTALGPTASTTGKIECTPAATCTITIGYDDSKSGIAGTGAQTVVTKAIL
jgi:type IV pilus assembly protein PilV